MSRPSDHVDSPRPSRAAGTTQPKLSPGGYLRFFWRQLTSMRTALFLLLLLAIAAVPGSMLPQRSSDPNGVIQYFDKNPELARFFDALQAFDVFSSAWFSSIYLLLFISLIGCVLPRTAHHLKALRADPPRTPSRLERLGDYKEVEIAGSDPAATITAAHEVLRRSRYRVRVFGGSSPSVSAERGYLRETGNLVFHSALVGVLIGVGVVGSYAYTGQKVLIEGQPFVNVLSDYSSFNPGRNFDESMLTPFHMVLNEFAVEYESENLNAYGFPVDYTADVTISTPDGATADGEVKVNHPLPVLGYDVFLLGNGYAPRITVRDGQGDVAFSDIIPFLPQDANLTSLGVVKVPDAAPTPLGLIGFFYPTAAELPSGALTSVHADLRNPMLTLNVYTGNLGLDDGVPRSVYQLDTDAMTQVVGGDSGVKAIGLRPGESATLPDGLGTVTFELADTPPTTEGMQDRGARFGSVLRFATFDITHDPSGIWALLFGTLATAGLLVSLFVPRRRVWIKATQIRPGAIRIQYAALSRGHDPTLPTALAVLEERHSQQLTTSGEHL